MGEHFWLGCAVILYCSAAALAIVWLLNR